MDADTFMVSTWRAVVRALILLVMLAGSIVGYGVLYAAKLPINAAVVLVGGNVVTQVFAGLTGKYGPERRWAWRNMSLYRSYKRAGLVQSSKALEAFRVGLLPSDVRALRSAGVALSDAVAYIGQKRFSREVLLRFLGAVQTHSPEGLAGLDLDVTPEQTLRDVTVYLESGFDVKTALVMLEKKIPISLALRPRERATAALLLPTFWETCLLLGIGEAEAHHWLDVMDADDVRVLDPMVVRTYREAGGADGWLWAAAGFRPEEAYAQSRSGRFSRTALTGLAIKRGIPTDEPRLMTAAAS